MAEDQKIDGQPVAVPPQNSPPPPPSKPKVAVGSRLERFKAWYGLHKKWTIPATVLLVILGLAAIPFSRYNLAGLVLKRDLSVKVLDSTANTPVSGATVSLGSVVAQTNSSGVATLQHIKVGHHKISLSKKYYRARTIDELVPILKPKSQPTVPLVATGRQVKVSVTNLINKNPVANAEVAVAGTTAKTSSDGSVVIVVAAGTMEQKATISAPGFNDADVTLKVSNDSIQDNAVNLTPAGKVYFLSKLSGKIDVVKTNLDGSDRQTVLAGTGNEDDNNTVLLASRDWKYLALLSRRAGGNFPSLYLVDTTNGDKVTTIDQGSVNLSLIGWSDDYFVYSVGKQNLQPWQPGGASIKSFNAQTKQLATLYSTSATGSSLLDAQYEALGPTVLLDNQLLYYTTWYQYPGSFVGGHTNSLVSIKPDGTNKKTIKPFDSGDSYFGGLTFHNPSSVYVTISKVDGSAQNFYEYNGSGLNQNNSLTSQNVFINSYPTYLYSPAGDHTFWSEPRDGKNTLFIGDENGQNSNQIATLSDYNTYGWYTDNYLLVSKNGSELYIMDNAGKQTPVKISDYHKPAQTFQGYGGGYGGL